MTGKTENAAFELPVGLCDHTQGPLIAPMTLVEYGNYENKECQEAYRYIRETRQRIGSQLRFVFRHFIPDGSSPHARHAAEAAEAAGAQGRFWEMHDSLFTHQGALENGSLVEYADALGLDVPWFLRDMAAHVHADRVRADVLSGRQAGVTRPPAFFLNGVRYAGAWDQEALLAAVSEAAALLKPPAPLPW